VAFGALFDACVIYPAPLRDILMRMARTGLFRARWTDAIHDEWIRNLLENRPDLKDKLPRTRELMNCAIDDCLVTGFEDLIPSLSLPDPDDRHVLAAAIVGRADVIVTQNLKDFPEAALAPFNIEAQHPDTFIRHLLDLDQAVALAAVRAHRASLKNPPMSVEVYLETLAKQELPETVNYLRPWGELI
jgi:predicted nucleic acid-binding protein